METRVLSTADAAAWDGWLERLPGADAHFRAAYHRAHEAHGDGRARAFVASAGDAVFFQSALQREITHVAGQPAPAGGTDLETVYGYGGPLCAGGDESFLEQAWQAYREWCRGERVVAEFVRFNPLSQNQDCARGFAVARDREVVVVDLAGGAEALWSGYPSVQRNMVRKAEKRGLVTSLTTAAEVIPEFAALYDDNMRRLDAGTYYFFGEDYFRNLASGLGPDLQFFAARLEGRLAAACCVLLYRDRMHYHLSASAADLREAAPVNAMLHTVARWGQEQGYRWLHLGGGRTAAPDDRLLAFKGSLSRHRRPFHIGRCVHDRDRYEALCQAWLRIRGLQERPPYFLMYRLENAP